MAEYVLIDREGRAAWVRCSANHPLPPAVRCSAYAIVDRETGEVIKNTGRFTIPTNLRSPEIPEAWPVRGMSFPAAALFELLQLCGDSGEPKWLTLDYRADNGFAGAPPDYLKSFKIRLSDSYRIAALSHINPAIKD